MTSDARNNQIAIFELKRPVSFRGVTMYGISMDEIVLKFNKRLRALGYY